MNVAAITSPMSPFSRAGMELSQLEKQEQDLRKNLDKIQKDQSGSATKQQQIAEIEQELRMLQLEVQQRQMRQSEEVASETKTKQRQDQLDKESKSQKKDVAVQEHSVDLVA